MFRHLLHLAELSQCSGVHAKMNLLALVIVALLFTFAHAGLPEPEPLQEGDKCFIGGLLRQRPCGNGQTCVINNFGNIPVDLPASGVCTVVKDPPNKCSVEFCTKGGSDAVCSVNSFVATCGAWANRQDVGDRPKCPEICTLECRIPRLVASNGRKFCNLCLLQSASCESGFKIFGPVDEPVKPKCKKPISIFDAAECCIKRKIGCLKRGEKCSTLGSRIRPVPCKKGLTCVIKDFGFPAADRPNSGRCRRVRNVRRCNIYRCSRFGPRYICRVPIPKGSRIISTCKAWARRSDGNAGPDCNFVCPEFCRIKHKPVASNGKKFCSVCKLRQASCARDFMIFGPIRRK